ncbi:hypothetical protein [Paraburkholderia sediminicola]|uniref:hypothetical protein n=1 Tax=Paraburkholderia sediminicola TaxID=458836 RepID=UPI0038B73B48
MIENKACVSATSATKIKVSEAKSRQAVVLNPNKDEFHVVNFDGCVLKNQTAADRIVSKALVGDLIVELKGKNVKHAMEQIVATVSYLKQNEVAEGKVGAIVVCNEYPRTTSTIQVLKFALKKKFDCPVKVFTKDPEVEFEPSLGQTDLVVKKKGKKQPNP